MDAMASGLPLVLSNKVETTERYEGNGLVYEENNSDALADALLKLEDKNIRSEMGMAGIHKIKEKYNWHNAALERITFYEKVRKGCI